MKEVLTRESHVDASETEPVHSKAGSSVTPMTQDIAKAIQVHVETIENRTFDEIQIGESASL